MIKKIHNNKQTKKKETRVMALEFIGVGAVTTALLFVHIASSLFFRR